MTWFNKHLNWTYVICLVVSIAINVGIFLVTQETAYLAIAVVISLIIYFGSGAWILRKKGQSLWLLALAVLFSLAFIIAVLMAENKKKPTKKKDVITDEDYYKKRSKK
jgi:hypothetical protein